MASKVNVIHRSSRGRTGVDVKAKTDSGCFVDDELEKQSQGNKSPPGKNDDLKKTKTNNQDSNFLKLGSSKKRTQLFGESDQKSVPQDVVEGGEMSRVNERPKNEIHDDLQGDIDFERSLENTEPREDFYCLYYSDSPNGSLTRRNEKSPNSDDIGARAEELLKKIKEDALRTSPSASDVEVQSFRYDQPPPVASKPQRATKKQSNSIVSEKDPILAELEKLGPAVGRDFTSVETDEKENGLLSNAVKELNVAETPEECFDKFDAIQTALSENIPDTLERSKARNKKDTPRRKSFPEVSKAETPNRPRKGEEKGSSPNAKKAESPKPGKKKFGPVKLSRSELQSLNSMREDSHHKRSHMNADNAKPVPTRSETNKLNRPDASKQLSEKIDSSKTNGKKDQKLISPKAGKPSPKKPASGSKDVAKKRERLELRSGRRRRSGDLSSIPENAVMDDRNERRKSDSAIPLARGEEDLSSEEDDDINEEDAPLASPIEENIPQQQSYLSTASNGDASGVSTSRTNFTCSSTTSSMTRTNIEVMTRSLPSQREEKTVTSEKAFTPRPFKQPSRFYSYRGRDQLSDGWTSESTAGYSSECSANDADDEGDKQVELEQTENLLAYDDPNEIVDMTFGSQMDDQPGIEESYVYVENPLQQQETNGFVDARDAAPMYYYPEESQEEFENNEFAFPGVVPVQDTMDTPDVYEFYQSEDGGYHGINQSDLVFTFADNDQQRHTVRKNTSEEHVQTSATQKAKKPQKAEGPDPSGFMTVEDIKRLIFQGAKPSIPRSTSCYGIPGSQRRTQDQEAFQRRSWSGYGVQQQQEPGIDPLVRNFPQKSLSSQRLPKGQINKSPYVRTVQTQRSKPQFGYYSDTQLNAVDQEEEYLEPSRLFRRTPLQRRSYSLETYHSDNSIPDEVSPPPVARHPARSHVLVRSSSDCSANYSRRQPYGQLQSRSVNMSPVPQYIDTEELAELVSSRSAYASGRSNVVTQPKPQRPYVNPNGAQYQIPPQSQRAGNLSLPRHSSENLRIQALRRASQRSSDSESDVPVYSGLPVRPNVEPTSQQLKLSVVSAPPQKTLSERFTEVPQRVTFEELAEKFNLGSDSDDSDEVDYGGVDGKPDSEFGADLEFDNGDYFDDNNMIVGEALRLKKVLGSVPEQDPELETLVTVTTDPKLPEPPQSVYEVTSAKSLVKQPNEALVFESPPPYHEVRRKTSETSGSESSGVTIVYDVPPLYESETDSHTKSTKMQEKLRVDLRDETKEYLQATERRDSETQTNGEQQPTEKAISAEELLKLLLNASQGNLEEKNTPSPSQAKSQQLVQNLCFPRPQTKAASTGNIHSEEKFPNHVSHLYGNSDLNSARSSLSRRRPEPQRPTCHKSQECIRYKHRLNRPANEVLQAKMIGSEDYTKKPSRRVFEEEVDCMKTKDGFDFSSGEISTSGSSIDDVGDKKPRGTCVSFVGSEDTTEIETLPRVKFSSQRKRRKARTGYLSDQDIPTAVQNGGDSEVRFDKSSEDLNREKFKRIEQAKMVQKLTENKSQDFKSERQFLGNEMACSRDQDLQKIKEQNRPEIVDLRFYDDKVNESQEKSSEYAAHEFPHDNLPSPNSVNVFIDYNKKNVMKITTSTPKVHHAKLVTPTPQGISPVSSTTDTKRSSPQGNGCSFGEEEYPPSYETSSSSDRSSSAYSSDDERFFGSSDTVVFVDKTADDSSVKPNVDNTTLVVQDQGASSSSNGQNDEAARAQQYSERVDCLLQEVRSSLDLDSIGSDLLDQAMERVKDKLSPRSSQNQGRGSITMEAFVALHQADELQAIINEIKGELWILQQENTLLKEKVVSLQHGEACSSSESTEDSLTESAERIDSIRKQIAAVAASKKRASECENNDLISVDVFLKGFGCAVAVRHSKKIDVKLGTVKVRGATDWSGVYDAAKSTFLDHVRRIDPCSCLGLGPTSMYGAQIGATMLTPETLRRKNPRVEISRKCNSCVIQLKDGMTETFDTLVYETLIPRHVVESFVHQILENRFIVLCGAAGLGKTFLATKLAEHLAQRFGSKNESPVLTLAVGQTSRKELKKTLADLMKCDISSPSPGVPVVVVLDQLDCLASLADIFDPKQLEGNRNSPFIIGVRNKSKKGPFSSKDLAVYKYFRWIQLAVHDPFVLGLLERFLRRKLSWADDVEDEEDLLDLFLWLTHVWQRINQILQSYVDIEVTIGPSVFYSCPMDMHAAEGWFANVWNYTIIPYLHQNLRNSSKIYERNEPWECPTKWVIMRWPWNREKSKVLGSLKKLRQVDIVLNRNHMESAANKGNTKASHSKTRKLLSSKLAKNQSPSKAGSLESWSTADWDAISMTSDVESIASSTL